MLAIIEAISLDGYTFLSFLIVIRDDPNTRQLTGDGPICHLIKGKACLGLSSLLRVCWKSCGLSV
ncbi:hypothetical protein FE392_00510 [Xenorhabdus sp. 12]|uniref:Uncharacterized protein n=1 Tax=Xenorhabdus santafensis TaxID=2582833 RepID=A0ABU4S5D2_9GAMM|nr:hypothetical protein [Xenorhabdus sp. 12]